MLINLIPAHKGFPFCPMRTRIRAFTGHGQSEEKGDVMRVALLAWRNPVKPSVTMHQNKAQSNNSCAIQPVLLLSYQQKSTKIAHFYKNRNRAGGEVVMVQMLGRSRAREAITREGMVVKYHDRL